ncbi:putative RNA-directed DNA polymerase from transposon X-element [Trichonephila clavipes]|nr:putative RNA-directed DNA polymerase from transposon X-element [Trichonephila clavipes]
MDIVSKLRHSFYVDNCVTGVSDTQDIESFVNKVRKIMSNGCFNLRGWESNAKKESISKCEGDTKGIFDPLGILTAATLLPKMWLQETWKVKLAWDSPLPLGLCNKFDKWFKEILLLQNLEIPRYCEMSSDSDLHVFVDASKNAYAACIFVRTKLASGIKLHLLRAKARVAPTKSVFNASMTVWVLRFLSSCRRQSRDRNLEELSTSEIEKAENTLISTVQKEYFPENNNIPHINTFVDNEGLIRVKTRIKSERMI